MKEFIKNDIYLNALYKKYEADIETAKANLLTYINTPVGVADHPDMIASMDELIGKIAEAKGKLKILEEGV